MNARKRLDQFSQGNRDAGGAAASASVAAEESTESFIRNSPRARARLAPNTRNRGRAAGTLPRFESVFADIVPRAHDENRAALGAVRIRGFRENIALVDIMQPDPPRNVPRSVQRFRRRRRLVLQLEVRMKRSEVKWNIRPEIFKDPFSQLARLGRIVVQCRNHQVGDLEPHPRFLFQPLECVQNRLKMRECNFPVEILGKGLQVDVRRVDMLVNILKSLVSNVAVCNHDGFDAKWFGGPANIDDVLAPDSWFVVSESKRFASVAQGEFRNVLGRDLLRVHLILVGLRDVPVLAEETAHIAPGRTHAEHPRARQKMVKRLLFDGINLQRRRRAVAQAEQFPVLVDADEAEPGLPVADVTMARAKVTVDAPVGLRFPPHPFMESRRFLEDLERRHDPPTSHCIIRRDKLWGGGCSEGNSLLARRRSSRPRRRHPERTSCAKGLNTPVLLHFENTPSRPALLDVSPNRSPLRKGPQPVAVFPGKSKKFRGIKVGGFFAQKCFEPPPKIGALPGFETVAARGDPVVSQYCPHEYG